MRPLRSLIDEDCIEGLSSLPFVPVSKKMMVSHDTKVDVWEDAYFEYELLHVSRSE